MTRLLAPAPSGSWVRRSPPTFSVVIAAYQVADLIGDCLRSVLDQTHPPFEIVVCDDGSTDGLERVLAGYGHRVRAIRQENRGAGAAMNAAVRAASGEYAVWIGADDVFEPGRLAALAKAACERPDLDILTTDAYVEAGGVAFRRWYDETNPFAARDQRLEIVRRNFVFGHVAIPRERFLELGGFDESIRWTSDWELWIRMVLGGSQIGLVPEPLARYRLHERSLSSKRLNHLRGRVQTLEKALGHPAITRTERQVARDTLGRARSELALSEAREALAEGRGDARRRSLGVALGSGHDARSRMKALAASVAPAIAGQRLAARAQREWIGAGGVHVPRA